MKLIVAILATLLTLIVVGFIAPLLLGAALYLLSL